MKRLNQQTIYKLALLLVLCLTPASAFAQHEKGEWPWNLKLHGFHDSPVAEKLGTGWFLNVGPTGLRARITHEHLCYFNIKFVFEDSPAAGKIEAGDIVVGANGKVFTTPHHFGRVSGWEGPMMDMAWQIEDSQGKDGKLDLIVWPAGSKAQQKTITLQLQPVGRFSKTYPFDCPRSDKLARDLCDFIVQEYKRDGKFLSRVHTHSACVLALMASGDPKYDPIIKRCMSGYRGHRYDSSNGGGFPAWGYGHDGIVMGEYYLLTRDESLLPAIESLIECMEDAQTWKTGGYSHRPSPFIMKRVAGGGPKGYGAMSTPGGLVMIAQSLFKEAGLDYSEICYQRLHQAFLHSYSSNGSIGYGFADWDHAVLGLNESTAAKAKSARGIGYLVPWGMRDIEDYETEWPTKADPRYRDTSWLESETDRIKVYELSATTRLAVRNMTRPEPNKPYRKSGQSINHLARSGSGALAHYIGNADNKAWIYMADHLAAACASSPKALIDGHASSLMHTLWGSLAASRADEQKFRAYMDYIKWWFIMAETHNGGFVVMPGRDYASTDHVYGNRNLPSATAALILSVKDRRLQITGADSTSGAGLNPLMEIQLDGFQVIHCLKEAKKLAGDGPFAAVLKSLDNLAKKDGERGAEAILFAAKLREWIVAHSEAVFELSDTLPAKSLLESEDYLKRLKGLEEASEILSWMDEIKAIKGIKTLIDAYEERDKIVELERTRGRGSKRQKLIKSLDKFISREGLDGGLRDEAQQLLSELLK